MDTIQFLTSVGALILGAAYILGGLIVNLHLSRFGVTEYQVLRIKYLVVGLIYLANTIIMLIAALFTSLLNLGLNPRTISIESYLTGTFAFSVVAILILIALAARKQDATTRIGRFFQSLIFLLVLSLFSFLYPTSVVIWQGIAGNTGIY